MVLFLDDEELVSFHEHEKVVLCPRDEELAVVIDIEDEELMFSLPRQTKGRVIGSSRRSFVLFNKERRPRRRHATVAVSGRSDRSSSRRFSASPLAKSRQRFAGRCCSRQ